MIEILDKILSFLKLTWKRQAYEYRFEQFDGSVENKQIKIANSVEYEFVNSGNSYVIINNSIRLYPAFMGIEPVRLKFSVAKNEQDVTVYNYQFQAINAGDPCIGVNTLPNVWNNILVPYNATDSVAQFNLLQVIIKQPSTVT